MQLDLFSWILSAQNAGKILLVLLTVFVPNILRCMEHSVAKTDLQIHWHEYVRSVAATVEVQYQEDAQVNVDFEDTGSFQPWLSIVTTVSFHIDVSKETQFLLLFMSLLKGFIYINIKRKCWNIAVVALLELSNNLHHQQILWNH